MNITLKKYAILNYSILLSFAEIFGLISIILIGLLFNKNLSNNIYDWNKYPFSYHPLMMTIGLLFCYGNGIILYRTFKKMPKYSVKIAHAILLISSLIFSIVGFVAIIKQKNLGKKSHFMTFHSWIGLATIILFILQWICGFISFLFPQLSLDIRKIYMPSHRLWGKIIFLSAVITILTGLSEHGMNSSFYPPPGDVERSRRLIINFSCIFTSLFTLIIIYLLSNPQYQRPPDQSVDPSIEL